MKCKIEHAGHILYILYVKHNTCIIHTQILRWTDGTEQKSIGQDRREEEKRRERNGTRQDSRGKDRTENEWEQNRTETEQNRFSSVPLESIELD